MRDAAFLLKGGRERGLFGAAEALFARGGRVVHRARSGLARGQKFFDLASLTKPLGTALLFWIAEQRGLLSADDPVGRFFPTRTLKKVPLAALLNHTAPLVAWRDFTALSEVTGLAGVERRKRKVRDLILNDPVMAREAPGTVYSDPGYIVLGCVLERVFRSSLDKIFTRYVASPLGLERELFFVPLEGRPAAPAQAFVPSEPNPACGGCKCGEVMDDNALLIGGAAGHAGLFGTAQAVHRVLLELRRAGLGRSRVFAAEGFNRYCRPDPARRARERRFTPGFDTPTKPGSQSGRFFSKNSIGHLGFSGTSFWWDLDRDVWLVLLANRCFKGRENPAFSRWRPRFHDAVMREVR